jgi:hypothetical protein
MGWELVLRVGPREGGVGLGSFSRFCPLLRHQELGRRLKTILMTWGGKKSFFFGAFCVGSVCFLLTTPPYSTSLLIPPWNVVAHYALDLSLHCGMCHYVVHCKLLLMAYWYHSLLWRNKWGRLKWFVCLFFFFFFLFSSFLMWLPPEVFFRQILVGFFYKIIKKTLGFLFYYYYF